MAELWQLGATQLAAGYRAGRFTPRQALQACLERSAQCNPALNAFTVLDAEGAAQAAQASDERWRAGRPLSPLDGVPVTVKDNLHVRGLPTHWGSRALAGRIAADDELPVARLRAAGAVLFGKTNVPEFTMQGYTDNLVFGVTRNPWNPALTPGGSSGGAVAAVAAGCCPLALATDGGGSIRRPAAYTNLVGFKPSRGRVPRGEGLPEIFLEYEVVGPIARSVDDALAMLGVLAAPASGARSAPFRGHTLATAAQAPERRRILYVPRFGQHPVDPRIAALLDRAAAQFAALGHEVETAERFTLAEEVNELWPLLSQVGLAWLVERAARLQLPTLGGPLDPALFGAGMQASKANGQAAPATKLFELLFAVQAMNRELGRLFEHYDALLTPAAAALPWPAAESHPPQIAGQAVGPRGHAVFTAFANAAGLPAIALPCGFAQALPVGLQLVGAEREDALILALARQFEHAHPQTHDFPEPETVA